MTDASRSGSARAVPTTTMLVRDIQMLITMNIDRGEIPDGALYVKANEIAWVGKSSDIPAEYKDADTVVSLPNRILLPGSVQLSRCELLHGMHCRVCHMQHHVVCRAAACRLSKLFLTTGVEPCRNGKHAPPHGAVSHSVHCSGEASRTF